MEVTATLGLVAVFIVVIACILGVVIVRCASGFQREQPSLKKSRRHLLEHSSSPPPTRIRESSTRLRSLTVEGQISGWDKFCAKVIDKFSTNSSQFAALILSEESEFLNIGQTVMSHPYSQVPPIKLNNEDRFRNYMVARPQYRWFDIKHAEETLMQKFDDLWDAYYDDKGSHPKYVILFTRLSPCSDCTDRIIETFEDIISEIPLCVTYSADWDKKSPEKSEECRQKLRDFGIKVERHIDEQ